MPTYPPILLFLLKQPPALSTQLPTSSYVFCHRLLTDHSASSLHMKSGTLGAFDHVGNALIVVTRLAQRPTSPAERVSQRGGAGDITMTLNDDCEFGT